MKAACIVLTLIIFVAIMAVSVMVKFATDITLEERKREYDSGPMHHIEKAIAVISMNENKSTAVAERFPYVAAIARNSSNSWSFACFASIVLVKWVVTSAHCRKKSTDHVTHRVLLLNDFARNMTRSYPILFWRIHEKFEMNSTNPLYDIAIAKFNVDDSPFDLKPSTFDEKEVGDCDACIWKTVSTMDRKVYLINDFDVFHMRVAHPGRCYETYGLQLDESQICVDLNDYQDCFIHEFGPIYNGDKLIGVLAAQPRDCEVKFAIFTNVSYFSTWILKLTHTTFLG